MKSAVETLEPTKVKLTVEVTLEELKPNIDEAYKRIAEQVTVPGFRKGKIPPRIIDRRVGRVAVIEHAVNEGLSTFYAQAVRDNELRPLGTPQVEVTRVPGLPDAPADEPEELHFTAEVEVRPTFELPALDGLRVTVDGLEVTDEDVTARLDALRERFGTLVGVDRPAAEGDYVVLDLTATIGDEQIDQVSGVSYQIGAGNMLEGMDEALAGLSAGETTTFSSALAGGEHAGEDALVTVTATGVKERQLPEANDDFAELASEFDTLDELWEDLRTQAAAGRASSQATQARDRLLERLFEAVEIPVPSGVVDDEVHRHLESEGRLEDDAHRAEVVEESTSALRRQILLDTLAESLDVKVSQSELVAYLVDAAKHYGMDPNEFITTLDKNGQIASMVGEVARSKSLAVALRQVTVVGPDGTTVDLSEFIGTDTADEPLVAETGEDTVVERSPATLDAGDISSVIR